MGRGNRSIRAGKRVALERRQASEHRRDTRVQLEPEVIELESTFIYTIVNNVDREIALVDEGCEWFAAINEETILSQEAEKRAAKIERIS